MSEPTPESFRPLAGIAAFILPGAGHFLLGQKKRAILIGAGVLGLFFGGMFIGGIDAIDSKEDPLWFAGQALVGPVALGVNHLHQTAFKTYDPQGRAMRTPDPDKNPRNAKSLGRMNEIGTLYATIAGMLNLIAILDALFHRPRPAGAAA